MLSRPSDIDLSDPESLEAAANEALARGDQATAMAYANQALKLRQEQRQVAGMGIQREQADRATRQETRGVLREGRARTDKARTQVEADSKELLEMQKLGVLKPRAEAAGIETTGLTSAEIAKELNKVAGEGRATAAAVTEAEAEAAADNKYMTGQVQFFDDMLANEELTKSEKNRVKAARARVANGGKFDTAMDDIDDIYQDKGPGGVHPTEDQALEIEGVIDNQLSQMKGLGVGTVDIDSADMYTIIHRAHNIQAQEGDIGLDEAVGRALSEYNIGEDEVGGNAPVTRSTVIDFNDLPEG
jgi:hypothetical protein